MKLNIEVNKKRDADFFNYFFFNRIYHKMLMVKFYPKLKNVTNEEELANFLDRQYNFVKEKLNEAVEIIKEQTKPMEQIAPILEGLLDEKFDEEYSIYPTLLPFSPYRKQSFFVSVAGFVHMNRKIKSLYTSTHELIHLLFFKKLSNMLNIPYTTSKEIFSEKFNIKPQAFHLLKEVYAPIIMNDSELKKFFPNYVIGNTELQVIRIQENDTIQTVEGFFSKKYKELKSQNLNPEQILNSMIEITKKISEGLETQHNLMSNIPPQEYEIKGLYNPIIYKE